MFLRGIRGATTVKNNTEDQILEETEKLLQEMVDANQIQVEDIASIFFSTTSDLNATFPAKAARTLGLTSTPLLCLNEIPVPGSLPMCIRILIHTNSPKPQSEMTHIYLKEAIKLRPDISATAEK